MTMLYGWSLFIIPKSQRDSTLFNLYINSFNLTYALHMKCYLLGKALYFFYTISIGFIIIIEF